jgi:hypothetical protein
MVERIVHSTLLRDGHEGGFISVIDKRLKEIAKKLKRGAKLEKEM